MNAALPQLLRWGRSIAITGLTLFVLAGCTAPQPELARDDLVGSWLHEEADGTATLSLERDGTFELTSVPRRVVSPITVGGGIDWSDTVDLGGTWGTGSSSETSLELHFEAQSDTSLSSFVVHTAYDDGDVVLYSFVDPNADLRFVFVRP